MWNVLEKFDFVSINSQNFASGPIETFYACGGAVKTTVDHIFAENQFLPLVSDCRVLEDCSENLSFHFPVSCNLEINVVTEYIVQRKSTLLWRDLDNDSMRHIHYQETVAASLDTIIDDQIHCDDDWTNNLNAIISKTTEALHSAAHSCVKK